LISNTGFVDHFAKLQKTSEAFHAARALSGLATPSCHAIALAAAEALAKAGAAIDKSPAIYGWVFSQMKLKSRRDDRTPASSLARIYPLISLKKV
jgi:hypothetical protein